MEAVSVGDMYQNLIGNLPGFNNARQSKEDIKMHAEGKHKVPEVDNFAQLYACG